MITVEIEDFYSLGHPVPIDVEGKTLWRVFGEVNDEHLGKSIAYLAKDYLLYAALGTTITGEEAIDTDYEGFFESEKEAWDSRHEFYMKHGQFDPDYFT